MIEQLNSIGQFIVSEMIAELSQQGHRATGKLIESLDYDITESKDVTMLDISFLDYGRYVETGRRAGARKVPIQALVDWVITKGIASGNTNVLRVAYAIQTKIFQEGIPTRGSLKFSLSGKRDKWFSEVVNVELEEMVFNEIEQAAVEQVDVFLDNMVVKWQKSYGN